MPYRRRNPDGSTSFYTDPSDPEGSAVEDWHTYEESDASRERERRRRAEEHAAETAAEEEAARRAEAERWAGMSYEERAAARGRGESAPGESYSSDDYYGEHYGDSADELSDFDRVSADIPIWGDLSGARGRAAAAAAEAERRRRSGVLGDLAEFMPSEDDLSVEYAGEGYVGDTTAEGALARGNWTDWAAGGLTDADRAMMEESRRESGRAARANREADLSALEARGMGGSGASLAAMLSAGEGAADRNAATDATMMGAAQQRQIGATDALGEWAAGETGYRRDREGRNTDRENASRESASEAAQQAHENRQAHAGMSLGMSPYGGRDPNAEEDEGDEAAGGLLSFFGDLF